jgi:MoxR-like ATPase
MAKAEDLHPVPAELVRQLEGFRSHFEDLRREIGRIIVGNDEVVRGTLTALFAGGHVLLEGVPGLGKTLLVKALAQALAL